MDTVVELEDLPATFVYVDNVTIAGETEADLKENKRKWEATTEKYNLEFNQEKSIGFCTTLAILGYIIEHLSVKPNPKRLQPLLDLPSPTDMPSLRRICGLFS